MTVYPILGQKKKLLCCRSPDSKFENWVGRSGFFTLFFWRNRESWVFQGIFFKVSKWGKLGQNAGQNALYKYVPGEETSINLNMLVNRSIEIV